MPLQNRVTPFGDVVAMSQRGLFTGNRGIIHDPATKTLLKKRWSSKAWLICTLDYKDVRREVMARRSWTELFFLDEATALAAGHRPCFCCRRPDAERFRLAWMAAAHTQRPSAPDIDAVLHEERLGRNSPAQTLSMAQVRDLPDGAMVASGRTAFILQDGRPLRWTADGYAIGDPPAASLSLLTPRSTVGALRQGYRPTVHPSASHPLQAD